MLHDRHREWLTARGLGDQMLIDGFGIETRSADLLGEDDVWRKANWIVLPYVENGLVVNHKWRLTSEKVHRMDKGAPLLLYNADDLKLAGETIITEGEWDTLASKLADMDRPCVSVPNGADDPSKRTEETDIFETVRYEWFRRHQKLLDKIPSFILAGDGDDPGALLNADLAVLLGVDRCKFITYPAGTKDLNEVLLAHGVEGVDEVLAKAKPYPVKGLYRFSDYPPRGDLIKINSRREAIKPLWPLVRGTLSIVTGWSGIGKTTMLAWIMADYLEQGVTMAVGSFETDPMILRKRMRATLMRLPYSDPKVHEDGGPFDDMIERQLILVAQHCGTEEAEMDLDYMIECWKIAAIRDGAILFVCDPWNEIEHKRRRMETEHEYIARSIRALKRFGRAYNVAVWVIAHPTKPPQDSTKPPTLYDVAGSSNWNNKADYGVIIHRRDKSSPVTEFICDKVRMGLPGKEGKALLAYNELNCGYDREGFD